MRICILGNSHAASLKTAWDDLAPSHPDKELVFFAARSRGLGDLSLQGQTLRPTNESLAQAIAYTSGGRSAIDLQAYDVLVTYGLALEMPALDRRYSGAVLRQACSDLFSNSLNGVLAKTIRAATNKPLYVGHNPQLAASPTDAGRREGLLGYGSVWQLLAAGAGLKGARVVPQPDDTLVDGWFTDKKYSVGSKRLDLGDQHSGKPHPPSDRAHMNKAFGKLWLEQLFRLAAAH